MKKYIIGLGTGRCGTVSLAKLLNDCKNVNVSHEFRERGDKHYRLSWDFQEEEAKRRIENLKKLEGNLVGDVAHYYLNYIDYLNNNLENVKFILLYRDASEVVNSFMKKSGNFCHWLSPEHPVFKMNNYKHIDWDRTFPKYDECQTKEIAIRKYYTEYSLLAYVHSINYKDKFFVLNIRELNNKQKELFDFLEIPEEDRVYQTVWENKS